MIQPTCRTSTIKPQGTTRKDFTMNITFDAHGINHATVAISLEMTLQSRNRHQDSDTLFLGGCQPTEADLAALASLALRKNYNIIFASFDPADPDAGPTGFGAAITDGMSQTVGLLGGRLWKRDRRSPAVLLFSEIRAVVNMNAKSRLVVREMAGRYHDQGFEFAHEAVIARAARKPGSVPVVAPMGNLITVLDTETKADMWAAAAA